MTSAHPPREHNPHAWADLHPVAEPIVVHSPAETDSEGGEPPSANPSATETAEPDGTGSSDSSNPDAKPAGSGGKGTRSRARAAGNPSVPEARTGSSSADSTGGGGTAP